MDDTLGTLQEVSRMSRKAGWSLALAVALTLAGAPRVLAQEADRPLPNRPVQGPASAVEGELKQLAEKIGRAVVGVSASAPRGRPGEARRGEPSGAGIVVRADGYVLTSSTVVPEGARRITVTLPGGMKLGADEASRDDKLGLVALKVRALPEGGLFAVEIAEAPALRRGNLVMTFGNPFGTITRDGQAAMSVGTLSGIDGVTLETDAAVNPGSFGGPLVNASGDVIGIVVPEYRNERWLGLARKADGDVLAFVNGLPGAEQRGASAGLVADDEAEEGRGLLGFYMYEDSDGPAKIEKVAPGGAADKAKLKSGDVIVALNGKKAGTAADLAKKLKKVKAGETITLRVSREEFEKEVKLTAEARPEAVAVATVKPWLGLFAVNLSGREGIAIDEITSGSPAEKAGLKKGDVLRSVNGKKINSTDEMAKHLEGKKPGDELAFLLERTIDGEAWEKKVTVKLGSKKSESASKGETPAAAPKAEKPSTAAKKGSGYLGVYLKDQPDGLVVENVIGGSPAEASGLKGGDRIVAVAGEKIDSIETFTKALQKYGAGDKVEFSIERGEDWKKAIGVTLGTKPEAGSAPRAATPPTPPAPPTAPKPPAAPTAEAKPAYLGVKLEETAGGLKVVDVVAGSPAEKSGVKVGQVITALDGAAVTTTDAFRRVMGAKKAGEKLVISMGDAKMDILLGAKN